MRLDRMTDGDVQRWRDEHDSRLFNRYYKDDIDDDETTDADDADNEDDEKED